MIGFYVTINIKKKYVLAFQYNIKLIIYFNKFNLRLKIFLGVNFMHANILLDFGYIIFNIYVLFLNNN